MNLNSDQVVALAPDPASAKAGRGLVHPAKWPTLGQSEIMVWGECQGSGSKPYQVSVDLDGLAFKCTCPSRKFPCKHGLGLLLLAVEQPDTVKTGDPPPWAANWFAARRDKAEKKTATSAGKAATPDSPADAEAAAKRAAKRLAKMREGGAELALWLVDQVRHGLATWPQQPPAYFAGVAARMVDAQVPGLANEILRLETLLRSGDGWLQRVLGQLGRLRLLTEGLIRFDTLPAPAQADLRAWLGWPVDKEEVLVTTPPVTGHWSIVGQVLTERDRLWERRTWLLGRDSVKPALLLDFMHGQRNFPIPLAVGSRIHAALAFYPAAWPQRALLLEPPTQAEPLREPFPALADFDAALTDRAAALAANPWLITTPFAIAGVIPVRRGNGWRLRDASGAELLLTMPDPEAWALLALSGGQPIRVFGEWTGNDLRVLSGWTDRFHGFLTTL
ncbi:MAG: SWIM zinc finger family protein [Candidatus Competibacteraceae bacterium]